MVRLAGAQFSPIHRLGGASITRRTNQAMTKAWVTASSGPSVVLGGDGGRAGPTSGRAGRRRRRARRRARRPARQVDVACIRLGALPTARVCGRRGHQPVPAQPRGAPRGAARRSQQRGASGCATGRRTAARAGGWPARRPDRVPGRTVRVAAGIAASPCRTRNTALIPRSCHRRPRLERSSSDAATRRPKVRVSHSRGRDSRPMFAFRHLRRRSDTIGRALAASLIALVTVLPATPAAAAAPQPAAVQHAEQPAGQAALPPASRTSATCRTGRAA